MSVRPINVLMVNDSLAAGGAERVAVDLANSLHGPMHHVHFCSTRTGGALVGSLRDDIQLDILGRTSTWDIARLVRFARLVEDHDIDIIHSHGRGTMKFVALARSLRLIDAQHVFHDHFAAGALQSKASIDLRIPMQHQVDAYLGVDARLCAWASDTAGTDPERTYLLRSGVDLERFRHATPIDFRERLGLGPDRFIVAKIANFRPQKDHPTLFRAIAELPTELQRRLLVVLVGSTTADASYFASCMDMVQSLGIGDSIEVVGESDDAPGVLAGADAALLSSKNETGPLVVLEYMASGLPFIATDTGEITHAVRDLGVGFVPTPRDHRALADALTTLLTMSEAERRTMGEWGRQVAAETFDQRLVTRSVIQVYEVLLGLRDRPELLRSVASARREAGRLATTALRP
jgi:glycosyltransferase involved in cell wall biosynthesis